MQTAATRQRKWWTSPERWLPVQLTFSDRLAPIPHLAWVAALLAMLVLAAAALLLAGVGQPHLPHFGAAADGQIAFVDGNSIRIADADGRVGSQITTATNGARALTFAPDGRHLAYLTGGSAPSIAIADADGLIRSSSAPATAWPTESRSHGRPTAAGSRSSSRMPASSPSRWSTQTARTSSS